MKSMKNSFGRLISTVLLVSAGSAYSATYNIYFNNAEQGNNSTAKPTVVVEDGKGAAAKQEDKSTPASQQGPEPASAPASPVPASSPQPISQPGASNDDYQSQREVFARRNDSGVRFRIMAGGAYNSIHSTQPRGVFDADLSSSLPFWEQTSDNSSQGAAPQLEGSLFFGGNFGATLVVGELMGVEGNVLPLGYGGPSIIQPELSLGILSQTSKFSASSGPTVGAKLAFNLTPTLALIIGGRSTVMRNSEFNFIQGNAGLAYIF